MEKEQLKEDDLVAFGVGLACSLIVTKLVQFPELQKVFRKVGKTQSEQLKRMRAIELITVEAKDCMRALADFQKKNGREVFEKEVNEAGRRYCGTKTD